MDELQAGVEFALAVLPSPSVVLQPRKTTLDDPALWPDLKVCSSLRLAICTVSCSPRISRTPSANGMPV